MLLKHFYRSRCPGFFAFCPVVEGILIFYAGSYSLPFLFFKMSLAKRLSSGGCHPQIFHHYFIFLKTEILPFALFIQLSTLLVKLSIALQSRTEPSLGSASAVIKIAAAYFL
jgi:hypothetical protein